MSTVPPAPPPSNHQFCTQCAATIGAGASACTACGFAVRTSRNFCSNCGNSATSGQAMCTRCGNGLGKTLGTPGSKDKTSAGILAILLGFTGAHKFYLGRTTPGIIMAVIFWAGFCCGFFLLLPFAAAFAMTVIGIVEGALILTKSDEEFQRIYVDGKKEWF